ncbi:UPF0149 family protein [Psychromonas sp.]|uniref:UPF0149 family protein n=1 Tax=Psychromonas sp. TaxID=1884585 RepID=UPI003569FC25
MNKQTYPYQALIELCAVPEIKNNAKNAQQMLGFICAVCSAPVELELQEWLPYLWNEDQTPSFSNEQLAVDFAAATTQFYDACLAGCQQASPLLLPTSLWLNESSQLTEQGKSFAIGYLSGFQHVEEIWQNIWIEPASSLEQILQTTTLLLGKLANPATDDPQLLNLFEQLPQADEIVASLPLLLSTLGHLSAQVNTDD